MSELVSRALCLLILWPALVLRFGGNTPRDRPAPRIYRRQVAAVAKVGPRIVGVRLQVVLA